MTAPTTRKPVVQADIFGSTLTLNFLNGKELILSIDQLSPDIRQHAIMHGLKQKLVDAAAIARNSDNGASATVEDKYNAVKTVYDRLTREGGTWNAIREGEAKAAGGIFLRAMMELTGKTKAQLDNAMESYSKEQIAALKKNQKIMDIMHRMEREAALAKADTSDDLLAALSGPILGDTEEEAEEDQPDDGTDGDEAVAPLTPAQEKRAADRRAKAAKV